MILANSPDGKQLLGISEHLVSKQKLCLVSIHVGIGIHCPSAFQPPRVAQAWVFFITFRAKNTSEASLQDATI